MEKDPDFFRRIEARTTLLAAGLKASLDAIAFPAW
jgi:hypothetical protein